MKIKPTPLREVQSCIVHELSSIYPQHEAQSISFLLLEHLLNYTKSEILLNSQEKISSKTLQQIDAMVEKLKTHQPLQYVIGEAFFYEHNFKVGKGVLIPRPETEELVMWVSQHLSEHDTIWDIGTGSGCIPISLASQMPQATYFASDISTEAINIAKINSQELKTNIHFLQHNILKDPPPEIKASVIISNPPYITLSEKKLMDKNVLNYEPETALFVPDEDPLLFYREILQNTTKNRSESGTYYFFEINEQYGNEMINLFKEHKFSAIELRKDIHGKDRMIKGLAR
jgi:release factor glutamine methyltransferase